MVDGQKPEQHDINILEILAIKIALISLCDHLENVHICIRSDNSGAVSYINNEGGSVTF